MLKAIVEGKHDAGWMADYAKGSLRGKRRELTLAPDGSLTGEQRWLLERELRQVEWPEQQIAAMEPEIARRVVAFEEPIRLLMTIPGVERRTAWTIVAEIGVEMSVFADAQHLASWAGLCPGNRESGGKRMSGRARKANRYVKRAMCQAAWAASHQADVFVGILSADVRAQGGAEGGDGADASHAVGGLSSAPPGGRVRRTRRDYYDQRNKPKVVARLVRRLSQLGYAVELQCRHWDKTTAFPPVLWPGPGG